MKEIAKVKILLEIIDVVLVFCGRKERVTYLVIHRNDVLGVYRTQKLVNVTRFSRHRKFSW